MATPNRQRSSTLTRRPSLPTAILPKIPRNNLSSSLDTQELLRLVNHLTSLYTTTTTTTTTTTDSAYSDQVDELEIDPLGPDSQFERGWTKSWLVSLLRRAEDWVHELDEQEGGPNEQERKQRLQVVDQAGALVAALTETSASGSILRPLLLPTSTTEPPSSEPLLITLNDALPSSLDPTSVGLQSWGSSIILSKLICLNPEEFGVPNEKTEGAGMRTLELGAGTGLLSLVWKGMSERQGAIRGEVIATDFHEDVLKNLRLNVKTNTPSISPSTSPLNSPPFLPADARSSTPPVAAHHLDWQAVHSSRQFATAFPSSAPSTPLNGPLKTDTAPTMPPPFDRPFHTLLAADVVYGPEHAKWLKSCVEQFLIRPNSKPATGPNPPTSFSGPEIVQPAPLSLQALEELDLNAPSAPSSPPSNSASPPAPTGLHTPPSTDPPAPAFHLIVPLRPTHTAAIASIAQVFPLAEELEERKEGEAWRVAVKRMRELGREKGVGRADEGSYRLYEIGWC
ncbi:hypothetical protein BCR35DRAFT_310817 [Leucosporidium creatinivorum]|uniref:Methyltransferase-domain-containing protein n=1 Tax=Leucosporidium creatinivorum TaxID=106004 RepID=A0A1Y2CQS2_9BASI|nr:hypothetical protein BCR35DRAFT_310817 [Leucosporidium creatinivorum]